MWVFAVVVGLGYVLCELYYRSWSCRVSDRYKEENHRIVTTVIRSLTTAGLTYWVDFATLLTVLRKEPLLDWDQDSDLGLDMPGDMDIAALMDKLDRQTGFTSYFDESRALIQVYLTPKSHRQGPHCDIWVYTRQFTGGEEFLCNQDNSGHYHCRSKCHILPLREVPWQGMGINVTIPASSHAVARLEYGAGYGKSELYRADCLHNAWHGRLWY